MIALLLSPALRKLVLAFHIAVSVGWLGAVVAYLPLDVIAATSDDAAQLRAAYVAMDVLVARAIVPLAVAAFASGLVISLGTKWGLFRHYWVIISLLLTALALAVLLVEARVVEAYAITAGTASDDAVRALPSTLPHSAGGIVVLVLILTLNVVKPRGVTPYGWRRERGQ